jgi:hypothetical protein
VVEVVEVVTLHMEEMVVERLVLTVNLTPVETLEEEEEARKKQQEQEELIKAEEVLAMVVLVTWT